jgi:hypothetical protein
MSSPGNQWTPARLRKLALLVSPPSRRKLRHDGLEEAAAALRDFAAVVGVLGRVAFPDSLQVFETAGDIRARLGASVVSADTSLKAILALAGQIEGSDGK